jgi:hypothetical protein
MLHIAIDDIHLSMNITHGYVLRPKPKENGAETVCDNNIFIVLKIMQQKQRFFSKL